MLTRIGLFGVCLSLVALAGAYACAAATYPLPAWSFSGSGNGSWSGGSSDPHDLHLFVTGPSSGPFSVEYAYATSSTNVLLITSNTTYKLTFSADLYGPANSDFTLLANGVGASGVHIPFSTTWTNYSTSFTTAGAADSRVGMPLRAQCVAYAPVLYGGQLSVTNIVLDVSPLLPRLTVRRTSATALQLAWGSNFNWYLPESATNLTVGGWDPVTNSPVLQANELVIDLSVQAGQHFFRLRQP